MIAAQWVFLLNLIDPYLGEAINIAKKKWNLDAKEGERLTIQFSEVNASSR
jgi:hypothetical protein